MERRFQQQSKADRSRGREKVYRAGDGFARILIEGNGQFTNGTYTSTIAPDSVSGTRSPVEEHSVVFEPQRISSKKVSRASIKALIHEEMSRDKRGRQSSPSVIARLMGLDTLPPPQTVAKQKKEAGSSFLKASYEDHSLGRSISEHQECKDVFEIRDSSKVERYKHQSASKGASLPKRDEADVAFVRQKFTEAKRLSTDETLRSSKEFDDALEVLDSNKDLFLKFLQEPNSVFAKHLHNLKSSPPPPYESHITILKSTKGKKYEIDEVSCKRDLKTERYSQVQKEAISSLQKPTINPFNQAVTENSGPLSHKLLKSRYAGKADTSHRTRIVVLKPNLEKAQDMSNKVSHPISHDNPFGYRRHGEFQKSGVQELHEEGKELQNSFENIGVLEQKTKGPREIAREITKQMRHSVTGVSDNKLASVFNRNVKDEGWSDLPGIYSSNSSESYQHTQANFDSQDIILSPLSLYKTHSTVSREAKKRLSERWRMTNRHQEGRPVGGRSSSLGEMLAESDREATTGTMKSVKAEKISDEKLARRMLQTEWYPSGISSRDGWKDECSSKLPRSSSLPSSGVRGSPKSSSRRRVSDSDSCYMLKDVLNLGTDDSHESLSQRGSSRRSFKLHNYNYKPHSNSGGEENELPIREIYVNQEEMRDGTCGSGHSEVNPMLSKYFDSMFANSSNLVDSSPVDESMDVEMPSMISEGHVEEPTQKGGISSNNHINEVIKEEDQSHNNPRLDSSPPQCDGAVSESLTSSSKGAEQPSPVSVLEPLSEEPGSSPECFERVSADLRDLRMQLKLLRLESDKFDREHEDPVSSEDDSSSPQNGIRLQSYRDEDDRDFAYLLDMLDDLGINDANHCRLLDKTAAAFDKLEEKYGVLEWEKFERKLLFDHIRSVLTEIRGPCMDLHPWAKPRGNLSLIAGPDGLAEEVWRAVARQRKELSRGRPEQSVLDERWLELGDDVNMIGREIEAMLKEELLEELVSEFVLC